MCRWYAGQMKKKNEKQKCIDKKSLLKKENKIKRQKTGGKHSTQN